MSKRQRLYFREEWTHLTSLAPPPASPYEYLQQKGRACLSGMWYLPRSRAKTAWGIQGNSSILLAVSFQASAVLKSHVPWSPTADLGSEEVPSSQDSEGGQQWAGLLGCESEVLLQPISLCRAWQSDQASHPKQKETASQAREIRKPRSTQIRQHTNPEQVRSSYRLPPFEAHPPGCWVKTLAVLNLNLHLRDTDSSSEMPKVMTWACVRDQSLSHFWLFVTPWTVACQAPLSMGFSKQEYRSGLPFPPPGDLPNPEIKPASPALAGRFFYHWATWETPMTCAWESIL